MTSTLYIKLGPGLYRPVDSEIHAITVAHEYINSDHSRRSRGHNGKFRCVGVKWLQYVGDASHPVFHPQYEYLG